MSVVRVCAITYDSYPFDSLVRRISEAGVKAGYEYHLICSRDKGQKRYEVFNGVHVHRVALSSIIGKPLGQMLLSWVVFTLLAFGKVTSLYLTHKFHVVHIHNMPDFLVFAAIIPKLFGTQVILQVQDVSPELVTAKLKGRLKKIIVLLATWQERISTAFADHVLTVGWPFEELLLKRGVPQQKLSSVLNSADSAIFPVEKRTDPFVGEPTTEHPLILMYHGTLNERSGLDIAIRAFVKARETAPYLRLYFKGRGESLPDLKRLSEELGVSNHVVFFPPCLPDELIEFLTEGDIGIIPYRSDGFADLLLPTKAYEFALVRRPMIVSSTVAMRSMFRPESVIFCEPSNVDSFAAAIVDLYQHPEKRAQLAANAEQDYAPYKWELMAERYQQLLGSLAAKGSKKVVTKEEYEKGLGLDS